MEQIVDTTMKKGREMVKRFVLGMCMALSVACGCVTNDECDESENACVGDVAKRCVPQADNRGDLVLSLKRQETDCGIFQSSCRLVGGYAECVVGEQACTAAQVDQRWCQNSFIMSCFRTTSGGQWPTNDTTCKSDEVCVDSPSGVAMCALEDVACDAASYPDSCEQDWLVGCECPDPTLCRPSRKSICE